MKILSYGLIGGMAILVFGSLQAKQSGSSFKTEQARNNEDTCRLLTEIYREVSELGYREKEDFIKREFHFELDGKPDNKEEHIVVLCHEKGSGEKMIIQITCFEEGKKLSSGRAAKEIKQIISFVDGEHIEMKKSGYCEEELNSTLDKVLKGIRDEKEIFKLAGLKTAKPQ